MKYLLKNYLRLKRIGFTLPLVIVLLLVSLSVSSGVVLAATENIWGTSTPSLNTADRVRYELGTIFSPTVSGTITGVRVYAVSGESGTHTARIWNNSIETVIGGPYSFTAAGTGWVTYTLPTGVAVVSGTSYTVSLTTGADSTRHYANTVNALTSAGSNGQHLTYPANAGVYTTTLGSRPTQTFQSSNYFRDIVFSPSGGTTATPTPTNAPTPTVTSTPTAVTVASTTSRQTPTPTNTPTPTPTPTTGVATPTPTPVPSIVSLWPNTVTPANPSENDPSAVEIGVKFTSDVAGQITGIKFYKGTGNTGTHIGNLWNSSGTKLATVTFSGESSSGWQTASFPTPVSITAGTTYIVSYFAPAGHYAGDTNYFAPNYDNSPLHAPSSASSGGNGVYRYNSSSIFPNSTYQATNYWVDVVFSYAGVPTPTITNTPSPTNILTPTPTGTANAYYIAPNGSDSNPGTLSAPFATLTKAQSAMQGSGVKTTYLRGATYSIAGKTISFGSSDNGESWLPYQNETPIIDGGGSGFISASSSNLTVEGLTFNNLFGGTNTSGGGFYVGGTGLTIRWNTFKNCKQWCLYGGPGSSLIDSNTFDTQKPGGGTHGGVWTQPWSAMHFWDGSNHLTISHNLIKNMEGGAIVVSTNSQCCGSNNIIDRNLIMHVDQPLPGDSDSVADFGAIYLLDRSTQATGNQVTNNKVLGGGYPANSTICIYLDDGVSNALVKGNICAHMSGGQPDEDAVLFHGGKNNTVTNNIFQVDRIPTYTDLWGTSSNGGYLALYQSDGLTDMSGNAFKNNIVFSSGQWPGTLWNKNGSFTNPSVTTNSYFSLGSGGNPTNWGFAAFYDDPMFANPSADDYTVGASSGVWSHIGWQAIPNDQGPLPNPFMSTP